MQFRVRRLSLLRFLPNAGIRLLDHLLAKVHADQIVLENVVVEHVFGRLAQVDDPFGHWGRLYTEGHVLRICGAGSVIVAADAADAAGDEMGIAGTITLPAPHMRKTWP